MGFFLVALKSAVVVGGERIFNPSFTKTQEDWLHFWTVKRQPHAPRSKTPTRPHICPGLFTQSYNVHSNMSIPVFLFHHVYHLHHDIAMPQLLRLDCSAGPLSQTFLILTHCQFKKKTDSSPHFVCMTLDRVVVIRKGGVTVLKKSICGLWWDASFTASGMCYKPIHHLILALTLIVYITFGNKLKYRQWARIYHTTSVFDLIDGWTGGNPCSQVSQSCGKPGNQMSRDCGTTWSSSCGFNVQMSTCICFHQVWEGTA